MTAVAIVAGYANRNRLRLHISSVSVPVKPKAAGPQHLRNVKVPLRVQGSWVLSALPDCFRQTREATGSLPYVLHALPAAAAMIRPPATIDAGNCILKIRADEAVVYRETDRLRVPPPSRFYRQGDVLVLLHGTPTGYVLRAYVMAPERK